MPTVTYKGPKGHSVFVDGTRYWAGVETEVSEKQAGLVREVAEQGYDFEVEGGAKSDKPSSKTKTTRRSKT